MNESNTPELDHYRQWVVQNDDGDYSLELVISSTPVAIPAVFIGDSATSEHAIYAAADAALDRVERFVATARLRLRVERSATSTDRHGNPITNSIGERVRVNVQRPFYL